MLVVAGSASAQLGIPGAAFALVDHGEVVAAEGLGVTNLRKPAPVTDQTLFMIGSNTKSMTTLLQAMLVDEGRVARDTPVASIYPQFRLGRDETTAKVQFRHLACMCTGIPPANFGWILGTDRNTDPAIAFRMLSATAPTTPFGEVFQYSNLMVAATGFIAAHLVYPDLPPETAYNLAMEERVFGPLGMASTTFDLDRAMALDHAMPHGLDRAGKPAAGLYIGDYQALRPSGAAWSNVRDMIKYVSKFSILPDAQIGAVLLTNSEQGGGLIDAFERRELALPAERGCGRQAGRPLHLAG